VVALVAALGLLFLSVVDFPEPRTTVRESMVPVAGTILTGTVAAGEQDVHQVHVDGDGTLAVGADEGAAQAVRLALRAPDGTVHEVGAADVDPGPAVRDFATDLAPGDYQVVVEGRGGDPTDYEIRVATGPELSVTPGGAEFDGELSDAVAGPLLLRGTGASVDITAHSDAFDTVLTVLPLGGSQDSDRLTNDDFGTSPSAICTEPLSDTSTALEPPVPGLNRTDSRVSVPTRQGEVYRVYVEPYNSGTGGPYTITGTAQPMLSLGQPLSQELLRSGATSLDLPDVAAEVSVETTGGSTLELTVNPGSQTQLTVCISRSDPAGVSLPLPSGPDRTLRVQNLTPAPAAVVVTAT
jgi:hypothetical protein